MPNQSDEYNKNPNSEKFSPCIVPICLIGKQVDRLKNIEKTCLAGATNRLAGVTLDRITI